MGILSPAQRYRFAVLVPWLCGLAACGLAGCGNGAGGSDSAAQFGSAPKSEAPAVQPDLVAKLRDLGAGVELDDQGRIRLITHREGGFKDDDLRLFSGLEFLETLRILDGEIQMSGGEAPPKVTDEGIAHLSGLRSLKKLLLTNTGLTDEGMPHLSQLTNLEQLILAGTGVSDDGLQHLANLNKLRYLDLSTTRITDAGLAHLHTLPNLRSLDLHSTVVTDEGLELLKRMTELTQLDLADCPAITDPGVEDLRQALPKCDIVR